MAKQNILLGQTDYTVLVFIPDSASTDGSGKTGLVAANLTVSFTRVETDNDVTVTDATSSLNDLAALTTAHTDWGLKEVSNTLAPGLYRLDIADAVFAAGAWSAVVYVMVTTSAAAASPMEFVLTTIDPFAAVVPANVTQLLGTAWLTPGTAGTPDVNVKLWNALTTVALPLVPTTAGRTLDVSAGGEAGVDWANVGSPTTVINFSGTTIKTATDLETKVDTIDGIVDAILVDTAEIGVAGAGLTNINLPNQTMDIVGNLSGSVGSVTGAVGSVTGLTASDVGAIKAKTDNLPASPAAVGSAMTLTSGERTSIADALLTRDWTSVTGEAARSVLNALRFLRNKWSASGGTLTVTEEDDTTTAWTAALTSDASADPVTGSDPA